MKLMIDTMVMRLLVLLMGLGVVLGEYNGTSLEPAELITNLPLSTNGKDIVDSTGKKVRLACANWYGFHLELSALQGLHARKLEDLMDDYVRFGFNCVRLPFSLELFFSDPPVPEVALAANPDLIALNLTGLQLMDIVINEFASRNILVMMNNHNSKAGWCCDVNSAEGLWSTPEYPTEKWIQGLEGYTQRYLGFPNVVAFDIRNEIHDVGDKIMTYGSTDDIDTDWKLASEAASERVLAINPDLLILITGYCFGYDLRPLHDNPPKLPVQNKLVFTPHTYGYSMWFNIIEDMAIGWDVINGLTIGLMAASAVGLVALVAVPKTRNNLGQVNKLDAAVSVFSWSFGLSVLFMVAGIIWRESLKQGGCLDLATDAIITMGASGGLAFLFSVALIVAERARRQALASGNGIVDEEAALSTAVKPEFSSESKQGCCGRGCSVLNLLILCVVVLAFGIPLYILSYNAHRYALLSFEYEHKWRVDSGSIPIWVGEFGTSLEPEYQVKWWDNLMQYFEETGISWAYWPFDGTKATYNYDTGNFTFDYEGYGLLNEDWLTVRHVKKLQDLQTIQQ